MLVSTFEILVKPIAPQPVGADAVARTVVQAYFLSISNLDPDNSVPIDVDFTAITPGLSNDVVTFFDIVGANEPSHLIPLPDNKKFRRTITIPACDTGLFILQPNVQDPQILTDANLEVRGYVDINVAQASPVNAVNVLISPEQRGTFIPDNFPMDDTPDLDFDQIAYSLPIANGRARLELEKVA